MPDLDIDQFRSLLLRKREDILALAETRSQSEAVVELDQSKVGRLSRMDALQQQAMAQAGQRQASLELKRIEAALKRCDDGSYGYCADCDEPIAVKRLELNPAAFLCIDCAQKRE